MKFGMMNKLTIVNVFVLHISYYHAFRHNKTKNDYENREIEMSGGGFEKKLAFSPFLADVCEAQLHLCVNILEVKELKSES